MKNLMYYTVGYNSSYLEMLVLHIRSLIRFNSADTDLLIITNQATRKIISVMFPEIVFDYLIVDTGSADQTITNKLKIYQYDKIHDYDKVLFCDADSLWNKSPDDVFKAIVNDKINVATEPQLMNNESGYWGNNLLSESQRRDITQKGIMGINGGVFGFKNNMSQVFKEIEKFVLDNPTMKNGCYEQPFLNVYLYTNNLINTTLDSFVSNAYPDEDASNDKHLIHFLGSSDESKLKRMLKFYNKYIH